MNLNASEEEVGFETIPIGVSGADENDNIRITQKALNEVKKIKTQNSIPDDYGLRVGVKGGGCSGMSYTLGFDASEKELDRVYETQGVRVFIDPKSLFYLMGVTLDYSDGLNGRGFTFNNPNATKTCGCGSSFGV
ncbi:MAG: HesB/IscA family protein [Bacteroidota bacterium]|nr:iron-sulfur cluster assembly accessory protein [bacterium]NBP63784.1 iron-sulfur cluster assembly accessory protein [Bacteroidota bacterium]